MTTPKNRLHITSLVHLNYGMIKIPFSLVRPLTKIGIERKLKAAIKAHDPRYTYSLHKMCGDDKTSKYGYATFAKV